MRICCDIDGVLADVREYVSKYVPHDWKTYFSYTRKFEPILPIAELAHRWSQHFQLYLVTGRPESNRTLTEEWLRGQLPELRYDNLRMRPDDDHRSGTEIKLEWFKELKPDLIIDDSSRTAEAATKAGYVALQVHGYRTTENDFVPENYLKEK